MTINSMAGIMLAFFIGSAIEYLVVEGASMLFNYIRKRWGKSACLDTSSILNPVDRDPAYTEIPSTYFNDKAIVNDAVDWCSADRRIVMVLVKTDDKAILATKAGTMDVSDMYSKYHKEETDERKVQDDDCATDGDSDTRDTEDR